MTDSKWHLVSTMGKSQILDDFCTSINFKRDTNENYIYRLKDAIDQGTEMKKENWYRVTINRGDVATYDHGWSSINQDETDLRNNTAYWVFGHFFDTSSDPNPNALLYTQSEYDAVVRERDARLTHDEIIDLRAGSILVENGNINIYIEVFTDDIWSNFFTYTIEIPDSDGDDLKFYRVKIVE
jgi:hypothetical protein